jgi:hypothetical protein
MEAERRKSRCSFEKCRKSFTPKTRRRKFCSERCRVRNYWATHKVVPKTTPT